MEVLYVEETPSVIRRLLDLKPFDPALIGYKKGIQVIDGNLKYYKSPPCHPRSAGYLKSVHESANRIAKSLLPMLPESKRPVLWLFSPAGLGSIGLYNEVLSIFDYFDAYGEFPGQERYRSEIREATYECARKVDLVLATNDELKADISQYNPETVVLRNGCDPDHFANPVAKPPDGTLPLDIESLPRPIIGYMGDIAPWLDLGYIIETAQRHPDWSIVLLGTWKRDGAVPSDLHNIYCPGRVSYELLPYFARHFDVGTIPFEITDLTRVVNPLKLYEYFAMGIPVLATSLPDVAHHEDLVYIAGSADEFVMLAEKAVVEPPDAPVRAKRIEVARNNSWASRGQQVKSLLEDRLREID
jgi:glycosyltransferase involved in cell wall biosynthesis